MRQVTLAGPRVPIHFPPAESRVRTRLNELRLALVVNDHIVPHNPSSVWQVPDNFNPVYSHAIEVTEAKQTRRAPGRGRLGRSPRAPRLVGLAIIFRRQCGSRAGSSFGNLPRGRQLSWCRRTAQIEPSRSLSFAFGTALPAPQLTFGSSALLMRTRLHR